MIVIIIIYFKDSCNFFSFIIKKLLSLYNVHVLDVNIFSIKSNFINAIPELRVLDLHQPHLRHLTWGKILHYNALNFF